MRHATERTTTMPAPVEPASPDLLEAAHAFFPDLHASETVLGHPDLVRIETPTGAWRVRRWQDGTPADDILFTQAVMNLAREAGIAVVPETVPPPDGHAVRIAGRLYSAQRWLPGAPPPRAEAAWPDPETRIDLPVALSPRRFAEVATVLARLHTATEALAQQDGVPAAPLAMLPGAVRQAHGRHFSRLRGQATRQPAIQRWLATGERLLAGAEPLLVAATEDRELATAVLHLGLWPAHVLSEENALSGLLGWERVAAGSPLLELAQAILRLQGWSDEAVEMAIAAYSESRPLAPEERRLLPAIAALDAVATTGRLLEQAYAAPDQGTPPTAVRAAIDMMLTSLTALDRNINAPVVKARRWTPRPPPRQGRAAKRGTTRERRRS